MTADQVATGPRRRVSVLVFEGFELLDAAGPIELLSMLPERFEVVLIGPSAGPVRSAQGIEVVAHEAFASAGDPDILMVPGGIGTRTLVQDPEFLNWLASWASRAGLVTSVCTGSGVLAAAGVLDGFRATSNKRAFAWAVAQGPAVRWEPRARWVEDGARWTSSGVAAGMDMTFALIAHLVGEAAARDAAERIEYEPHTDAARDPFAVRNGLA